MQPFLLIQASNGRSYRVVRRGYHMVVEQKAGPESAWDPIYKVLITQDENAEATALVGAIRKALYFADDLTQIGFALSLLKEQPLLTATRDALSFMSLLPRDAPLSARVPKALKELLEKQRRDLSNKLVQDLTLSDYLIRKLTDGSHDSD